MIANYAVARFDQNAIWAKDYLADADYRAKVRLIRAMVPDDVTTVLDVGCGNGAVAREFSDSFYLVSGDLSRIALTYVQARSVQLSAEHLPFAGRTFDLVMSHQMLEHVPDCTFQDVVEELNRVTRRYLIISVPYGEDLNHNRARCAECGHAYNIWGHQRAFRDVADLRHLFCTFRLRRYAFCGHENEYMGHFPLFLVQELGGDWARDPTGICPRCGSRAQYRPRFPRRAFASLGYRFARVLPRRKAFWWIVCMFERIESCSNA